MSPKSFSLDRSADRGGRFLVQHVDHVHPPYGLWRVVYAGAEIGRQLSCPCLDDCERMLNPPAPVPVVEDRMVVDMANRRAARGFVVEE